MNVYIFEHVDDLTTMWHSDGGAVVVAESLQAASEALNEKRPAKNHDGEDRGALKFESVTAYATDADAEPVVYIFPDAGCC